MRTGTGFDRSGVPTITATGSSPNASRNTTKRVRTPELSGTCASPAMASDCVASARNRATALASTVTIGGSNAAARSGVVSATSTAGSTCASLTRSIAAIAAGPAGSGRNAWSALASATSARIVLRIDVGREFQRDRRVGVDARANGRAAR